MKLATAAEMKEVDRIAIEERGIPSLLLMEYAAEGIVKAAEELAQEKGCAVGGKRAAVFAGPGNNGGDGVAAARLMVEAGWQVELYLLGERSKMTRDCAAMASRLPEVDLTLQDFPKEPDAMRRLYHYCSRCDVFVDALFGVGLCRNVEGSFAGAIALMNSFAEVPTVAADIASGLSADTGRVLGIATRAAVTVTFSTAKPGHFLEEGSIYTGKLRIHDIGIPPEIVEHQQLKTESVDADYVRSVLPKRKTDGHKGDFGKDYILAGSVGFTGAPVFAAKACVRTGAGLVTVGTPAAAYPIVAVKCMEEMPYPLPEHNGILSADAHSSILAKAAPCDAVLMGPGLGRSAESDALIRSLLRELKQPLVLDADGINAVSEHIDVLLERADRVTVLTPHDGEFARLGGDLAGKTRLDAARDFAREHRCVLVLKGHRTIVAAPDGRATVNTTGNSGMAKGGSGDVLAGMILSLIGQGAPALEAAAAAVWLHGRAGDLAAAARGEYGMTPSDLLEHIPDAILEL